MTIAQSSALRAMGPGVSKLEAKATTPKRLGLPYVGFNPVIPVKTAGSRIDPPVSVPVATGVRLAATYSMD